MIIEGKRGAFLRLSSCSYGMQLLVTLRQASMLYERGEPLRDAWLTFADDELRSRLSAQAGAIQAFNKGAKDSFSSGLMALAEAMQRRLALEEQMRSDLLDDLFNEQLIATGYQRSAKTARWPTIIGSIAFDDGEPDWKAETITWRGQLFASVRITDPALILAQSPSKRKGRPGSGKAINEAIERVMASNRNFCELNRANACQLILDEIGIKAVPGNGLSAKSLERYIRHKCGNRTITN